jgi:hypothetical protein
MTEDILYSILNADRMTYGAQGEIMIALTTWNSSVRDYEKMDLFGAHLLRNYGGVALAKAIMDTTNAGVPSLTQALGGANVLQDALKSYAESLIFCDDNAPEGVKTFNGTPVEYIGDYEYRLEDRRENRDSVFYNSSSARTLPAYSVDVHLPNSLQNLSGEAAINFTRPNNSNVKIFLIVR